MRGITSAYGRERGIDMEFSTTINTESVLTDASQDELVELLGEVIDALLEKHMDSFDIVASVVNTLNGKE